MKIILLRHEERGFDVGFYSNLTENGIIKSCILSDKLKKLKIDEIYCSPFIRTLQTIYPFADKYNKKVNLEYGLYEYIHNPYFLFNEWYYTPDDIHDKDLQSIINKEYTSSVTKDDFNFSTRDSVSCEKLDSGRANAMKEFNFAQETESYVALENEINLEKRIRKFFSNLKIIGETKTILIVTHKGIINKIKDLYFEKTDMDADFDMGEIFLMDIQLGDNQVQET